MLKVWNIFIVCLLITQLNATPLQVNTNVDAEFLQSNLSAVWEEISHLKEEIHNHVYGYPSVNTPDEDHVHSHEGHDHVHSHEGHDHVHSHEGHEHEANHPRRYMFIGGHDYFGHDLHYPYGHGEHGIHHGDNDHHHGIHHGDNENHGIHHGDNEDQNGIHHGDNDHHRGIHHGDNDNHGIHHGDNDDHHGINHGDNEDHHGIHHGDNDHHHGIHHGDNDNHGIHHGDNDNHGIHHGDNDNHGIHHGDNDSNEQNSDSSIHVHTPHKFHGMHVRPIHGSHVHHGHGRMPYLMGSPYMKVLPMVPRSPEAHCHLYPNAEIPESKVKGHVTIIPLRVPRNSTDETPNLTEFRVDVSGVVIDEGRPNRKYGFHIHENKITDHKCSTAGGHFNPLNKQHGSPDGKERHVGDLGNIEMNENGTLVRLKILDSMAEFYGENSIIGKSIVFHEGEDDLGSGGDEGSKTTGNAGRRLACCTIKYIRNMHAPTFKVRFNG